MCGIVGKITFRQQKVAPRLLEAMRDAMVHRGPDGSGIWLSSDETIGFAHRRLAIVDLSDAALQPMVSVDGNIVVTFNGEIYNHRQLRLELIKLGFDQWQTDHSDTEVIINAYKAWGIDCLQRFEGMFAFCLWDIKQRCGFLVRDRIGVKPLYYRKTEKALAFASEIKAIIADPDVPRKVNEAGLYHYLSFMTTPAPMTLFAGINKLEPGHYIQFDQCGKFDKRCYWSLWQNVTPQPDLSFEQASEQALSILNDAVNLRARSDVPVGVFLSGGVDSSTNAALFAQSCGNVKTFSIGYDRDYSTYQNELIYAQQMAKKINADHYERKLNIDDCINFLPEMVKFQDEPLGDPVCVPVYYVAELARRNGVIVTQVGEGADELFFGYDSWRTYLKLQKLANVPGFGWAKKLLYQGLRVAGKDNSHYAALLSRDLAGHPVFWGGAHAFTEHEKQSILSGRMRRQFAEFSSWQALEPYYQDFKQNAWNQHPMNWMSSLDLHFRLPELLLMRVDKMAMATSIEARVPFLDHRLVTFAMSIDPRLKLHQGQSKAVLKHAVRDLLPHNIINRPKQGFGAPVYDWFFDRLGNMAKQSLRDFCDQADFFDWQGVESLFARKQGGQIWYLLNVALWWQHFCQ